MEICDHGIDPPSACPLCRKFAAAQAITSGSAAPSAPAQQVTSAEPVRVPNEAPKDPKEITDPIAKSVLQLAEEYARAQDEVAAIKSAKANFESMLRQLATDLAAAEKLCAEKQEALHAAVSPAVPKEPKVRKPRKFAPIPHTGTAASCLTADTGLCSHGKIEE